MNLAQWLKWLLYINFISAIPSNFLFVCMQVLLSVCLFVSQEWLKNNFFWNFTVAYLNFWYFPGGHKNKKFSQILLSLGELF